MASKRSRGRNVHFYNALDPDHALGGLILSPLNPSVTQKMFLFMLGILIRASHPYSVTLRGTDVILTPSDELLKPGHYDLRSKSPRGSISITAEQCILRDHSRIKASRTDKFRNQVRERDARKCVITGIVNTDAEVGSWDGFEVAHVFPISHKKLFVDLGFSELITNRESEKDSGINSCQNGLLMRSCIHQQFDGFDFSINPDDNYKIVTFRTDPFKVGGRILDPICRAPNDELRVRDELLRWHFRQAVLINVRGDGEPGLRIGRPARH
ncbi:hypothetical protein V1517DRAFT_348042 [Lipomyces orientalis]|uniref:Uncharacterized protein n=1 Tax=Lipomyces orientalis TaxID=1233043 RepID=A0ACC3TI83_9ASCO